MPRPRPHLVLARSFHANPALRKSAPADSRSPSGSPVSNTGLDIELPLPPAACDLGRTTNGMLRSLSRPGHLPENTPTWQRYSSSPGSTSSPSGPASALLTPSTDGPTASARQSRAWTGGIAASGRGEALSEDPYHEFATFGGARQSPATGAGQGSGRLGAHAGFSLARFSQQKVSLAPPPSSLCLSLCVFAASPFSSQAVAPPSQLPTSALPLIRPLCRRSPLFTGSAARSFTFPSSLVGSGQTKPFSPPIPRPLVYLSISRWTVQHSLCSPIPYHSPGNRYFSSLLSLGAVSLLPHVPVVRCSSMGDG